MNCSSYATKEIQTEEVLIIHERSPEETLIASMKLLEARLQSILRNLIKLFTNVKDQKNYIVLYKEMYMETLKTTKLILASKEAITDPVELGGYYYSLFQTLYQLDYKWECVDKYKVKEKQNNINQVK